MSKDISICIPVYKNENLLERALTSVKNQTFKNNITIIIQNDGDDKKEEMIDIISKFTNDLEIIFDINEKNIGILNNRLKIWNKVETKYIFNLDPDDELGEETALEKLFEKAENENLDIINGQIRVEGNIWKVQPERAKKEENPEILHNYLWGKLLRTEKFKEALAKIHIQDKYRIDCNEDTLIMYVLRSLNVKESRISENIYKYHMDFDNPNSISVNNVMTDDRFDRLLSALYTWFYMATEIPDMLLVDKNFIWRRREQIIYTLQTGFGKLSEIQMKKLADRIRETNPRNEEEFGLTKTISVLIPVYNREGNLLRRALNSVGNQTYNHSRIEVLIVNDGDGKFIETENDIEWFKKQFPDIFIKVIYHTENKGILEARRTLVENATKDYLTFLDSDDMLTENALVSLASASLTADYIRGRRQEAPEKLVQPPFSADEYLPIFNVKQAATRCKFFVALWSHLFKTDLVKKAMENIHVPFRVDTDEDTLILWEIQKLAKEYQIVNSVVYTCFTDNNSITRGPHFYETMCTRPRLYEYLILHVANTIEEKNYWIYRYSYALYQVYKRGIDDSVEIPKEFLDRVVELQKTLNEKFIENNCFSKQYRKIFDYLKEHPIETDKFNS